VPGDGSSLWCITHNSDFAKGFVGLAGTSSGDWPRLHITSDEVLTWDQFYRITAEAAGVEAKIVHIASDFLGGCCQKRWQPDWRQGFERGLRQFKDQAVCAGLLRDCVVC